MRNHRAGRRGRGEKLWIRNPPSLVKAEGRRKCKGERGSHKSWQKFTPSDQKTGTMSTDRNTGKALPHQCWGQEGTGHSPFQRSPSRKGPSRKAEAEE